MIVLEAALKLKTGDREEIMARIEELSERRREKQPLEYPSAGSTFKRPEGYFAGKLIEDCGLKGFVLEKPRYLQSTVALSLIQGRQRQKMCLA